MSFSVVAYRVAEADLERSRITDLAIIDINGTPHLISTTRYDGILQSWDISGGGLVDADTLTFDGGDQPGTRPTITALQDADGPIIQIGGGPGGVLQTIDLNNDGTFGLATTLDGLPTSFGTLGSTTSIRLASGQQVVYGARAGEDGIAAITYSSAGSYQSHALTVRSDPALTNSITATATVSVDGQTFLFTANNTLNAVTSWAIDTDGTLSDTAHLTPADGLWISAPQVMETTTLNGVSYVVLGSAGSGTISVMEVGTDGSLTIRDHLIDDRTTRFGGITALEIIQHDGQTHILAAGADDGVSVFQLLDGGYLIAKDHIADTTDIGLDNVGALAAIGRGAGFDIFVASSSEAGVTQLRYDTGLTGVTTTATLAGGLLTGTGGNDILQGHDGDDQISAGDGDDILRDGNGSDILTGGAGADIFLLSADGQSDTITDFTLGEDKLDLSLWPLLRDMSQLTMRILSNGFEITYGDEILTVESADGALIDYRDLQNSDLLGSGTRLGTNIVPGYPGPERPPPGSDPPEGPQAAFTLPGAVSSVAGHVYETIRNRDTFGTEASERADGLHGGSSDDIISAGAGADIVFGGEGNDQIDGGAGADILLGGTGDDILNGGADGDIVRGGAGNDVINGGAGDDLLIGDAGADTFVFNGGRDEITDFVQGFDQILLDPALWTGLTSAADVLAIYGTYNDGQVVIQLDDETQLTIDGVSDYATFADDISLF